MWWGDYFDEELLIYYAIQSWRLSECALSLSLFCSQANEAVGLTLSQIIAVSLKMYQ